MAVLDQLLAPSAFQKRFFFLAKRFVAGETIAAALETVRRLNAEGMSATLDFLGEDVTDAAEAERARDVHLDLLAELERSGLRANLSVKLSALGLLLDEDVCFDHLTAIVSRAETLPDPFVHIDMEGSNLTALTLRAFERAHALHRNVGPVIQAYLKRSPSDIERAIELEARVRLCKGAYSEPESIAFQAMPVIRREFLRLAEALLSRGAYPGIATHDERIIEAIKAYTAQHAIGRERFEFQMLYGVRPDLQRELVRDGYDLRIYVPFGTHWAGYFYRRIAERRENALFALRSLIAR